MRRGGRLVLLLGVVIAAAAALFLLFFVGRTTPPVVVDNAIPTEAPKRQVIVARIDIPNNTVLTDTETYLQSADIPEADYNSRPNDYFTSVAELQGKVTVQAISATTPILRSYVVEGGLSLQIPPAAPNEPRPKAYPLQVNNLSGVADQIRPGDQVDVLATFSFTRVFLRPSFNEQGQLIIKEETISDLLSTKTLVQNVEVMRIVKQPVVEGTPTPGGPPPEDTSSGGESGGTPTGGQSGDQSQPAQPGAGTTLTPGNWMLVLALTDQEAEIVDLSRRHGNIVTLVLRGRGDTAVENTIGATVDLLVSRFGLPLPNPAEPALFGADRLTPLPTIATTATPVGTPAATPSPTP
ncbi:MAG: Flp pilus assembly protein CpaB [Roseiflexaceae bacterium]